MKRRRFLQQIGFGAFLASSLICGCSSSKSKPLEEFLNFPLIIPQAEKIEKFPIEGARYCIVHLRQRHHVDFNPHDPIDNIFGEHKPTKKELESINSHQKSIYEILLYLKQSRIIDSVYLEGVDSLMLSRLKKISLIPPDDDLIREVDDLESKIKQRIVWDVPQGYTPEKLLGEYIQKIENAKKRLFEHNEKYKYFYGGGLRLVLEGKIQPRFENLALNNKAYEETLRTGKPSSIIFDDREDDILMSISKGNEKIAVIEFGGAHAWGGKESCGENYDIDARRSYKDNIAEWNKEHPDKKFCLIEITPRGYKK